MARTPAMSATWTQACGGLSIMGLDQSLREAFMDARLANEWYAHGDAWARMDMHGVELSRDPVLVFEEK